MSTEEIIEEIPAEPMGMQITPRSRIQIIKRPGFMAKIFPNFYGFLSRLMPRLFPPVAEVEPTRSINLRRRRFLVTNFAYDDMGRVISISEFERDA